MTCRTKDRVTPAVRSTVLLRDGACVLFVLDISHVCRDVWGCEHSPYALDKLTLEHVKPALALGERGPSEPRWMVAMCWAGNVGVPSKTQRAAIRAYLERRAA